MTLKKIKSNLPLVAIVGRANVGKSTLFNKMIEEQKALISKIAGTTRDLNFGFCEWQGNKFEVVDTGGIFEYKLKINDKEKSIEEQTEIKARDISDKADLILFLVDAKSGIMKADRQIAQLLKKEIKDKKKTVIMAINKIDSTKMQTPDEFKKLGLGDGVGISATTGSGVGDLLDETVEKSTDVAESDEIPPLASANTTARSGQGEIKVSIIGKPNVGKSSLLNKILDEERAIVSETAHTTREPQDTFLEYAGQKIKLIDTAGVRRKNKIRKASLEKSGIEKSIKVLKQSDLALFVIDISKRLTAQDAQLAGLLIKSGVSLIFVANKYDLIEKGTGTKEMEKYIQSYFPFLTYAPIIFVSALSGRGAQKILPKILEIKNAREKKIDKKELNEFLHYLMKKMPPPKQSRSKAKQVSAKIVNKRRAYIAKITQAQVDRPIFELKTVNEVKIPESYLKYLQNNLRKRYGFEGTPIKIKVARTEK